MKIKIYKILGVAVVGDIVAVNEMLVRVVPVNGALISTVEMGTFSQYSSVPRSGRPVEGSGRGWSSMSVLIVVGTPRSIADELEVRW